MSFISHAQNFEDVLLWRALHHVGQGTYLDIGAQHPVRDSVSRAFYEQGWRGIHVEPTDHFSALLRADRPDETIIQAAAGEPEGTTRFFEIPDTGMSTALQHVAERAMRDGWTVRETCVEVIALDRIFAMVGDRPIHWMKIDVEGFERAVLASWCQALHRPWVVLIEAVTPLDGEPCFMEWEPLILAKGYIFAHFDGLNRYYVAQAKADLLTFFTHGPCIFDNFQISEASHLVRLIREEYACASAAMRAELADALTEIDILRAKLAAASTPSAALATPVAFSVGTDSSLGSASTGDDPADGSANLTFSSSPACAPSHMLTADRERELCTMLNKTADRLQQKLDESRVFEYQAIVNKQTIGQLRADLDYVHHVLNAERLSWAKERLETLKDSGDRE